MLTPAEIESASMLFDGMMKRLEESVMQDIVRRIRINGEITRSADWQMHRLYELGESRRELSRLIKDGLQIDDEKLTDMFRDIICSGYARDDKLYKMTGKLRLPFAENAGLQQYISAVAQQTGSTMKNLSQSMGFSVNVGGRVQFQPIAAYYQDTLDNAVNGIATGAFDYNTVLKRTVKEMTDSGLRTVDYASGHVDRVDVAARRAVMTGLTQITAKVNDDNAKALETDTFEISWHSGARPSHQVWQGRWYTEKELTTVCGLGSVTGLCGANCYHSYYPVIPGVSVPNYTEEELDEMNRRENEPVEYNGREYTKYEATQRQRYLERKMRAQRQEIKLLQDGGADENDLIAARCRYRQTSQTYKDFSNAMELPEQRQRVTIDGLGNIGQGKWKNPSKPVAKSGGSGIMETGKGTGQQKLKSGRFAEAGSDASDPLSDKRARHLYDKMTREERLEVIQRGQNEPKPVFSYDRPDNKAISYLQKTPKEPDTFDVISHGSVTSMEFFRQDYPGGDRRASIDPYTLSCILKGRSDYMDFVADCRQRGVTPTVRLLSCNTGNTTDTGDCFAQLLANELGHDVTAPTKKLYAFPNGSYTIGKKSNGTMKPFYSRKN